MLPCVLFVATIIGCSKNSDSPAQQKTVLKITVTDGGSIVPGATVKLYTSLTDFQNGTNVNLSGVTDNTGVATFTDVAAINYYFYVQNGCKDNYNGQVGTTSPVTANIVNYAAVSLSSVGTLKISNTSANPYKVYVNGNLTISSLPGNSVFTLTESPAGNYTIRVVQISGYVLTPTDKTFTGVLTCGGTLTTTFP